MKDHAPSASSAIPSTAGVRPDPAGEEMHAFMRELYPICRSITGEGLRRTLAAIGARLPLQMSEVPTGTEVFDWTVPKEWNLRDAYLKGPGGEKVVDFRAHNLHVLNYSAPVRAKLPLSELKAHLQTLPDHPAWIPYRTSYYKEAWGFCLTHDLLASLPEGEYEAVIDSTLEPGALSYGEHLIQGESEAEVLISCHVCHPSLANDNLSGIAVAVWLAAHLAKRPRRLSYRFVFLPGTIGAVAWLARNPAAVARIRHGLVISGVGNSGPLTYKRSLRGDTVTDRAAEHVLKTSGSPFAVRDFTPYGYDERQYCSPGFNLAVGRISRTPYGEYPEYHSSADNLDFVKPERLAGSLAYCEDLMEALDLDGVYVNTSPYGEPQLGKRGLYRPSGGAGAEEMSLLWVLSHSDGKRSLLDIAERSGLSMSQVGAARDALLAKDLLRAVSPSAVPGASGSGRPA